MKESGLKWFDQQDHEDFPYCSLLKNSSESDEKPENVDQESSSVMEEEIVMVPVCTSTRSTTHEINSLERNSALSRYKEEEISKVNSHL